MVNLNGHAAGNGGHSQRTPKAHWGLLYSEGANLLCAQAGEDDYVPHFQQRRAGSSANLDSNESGYLTLPTGWSSRGVDFGAEAASALSFMTQFTVDGYNGQDAWNFFTSRDSTQLGLVYHNEPQWSIEPMP